ncbi:MAG: MTAP family purine nucleoside phosphorylase [Methanocorpusculum sp.]|nr:MTAP family purine nucleoside phosphorylase [Methanocorpusculum sp.]
MLGIIGGTALLQAKLPPLKKKTIATPFGSAEVMLGDIVFLSRHQGNIPPHKINHRANLSALKICGVDKLIVIGSTGGMKPEYTPGSFVILSDWFSPFDIPTLHDNDVYHVPPSVDSELSEALTEIVPSSKRGVYFQAHGPRFETKAEIKFFSSVCDVVGMTAASELTLANELKIPAAALCTVDNFANGVGGADAPDFDEIVKIAKSNGDRMTEILSRIVKRLK